MAIPLVISSRVDRLRNMSSDASIESYIKHCLIEDDGRKLIDPLLLIWQPWLCTRQEFRALEWKWTAAAAAAADTTSIQLIYHYRLDSSKCNDDGDRNKTGGAAATTGGHQDGDTEKQIRRKERRNRRTAVQFQFLLTL